MTARSTPNNRSCVEATINLDGDSVSTHGSVSLIIQLITSPRDGARAKFTRMECQAKCLCIDSINAGLTKQVAPLSSHRRTKLLVQQCQDGRHVFMIALAQQLLQEGPEPADAAPRPLHVIERPLQFCCHKLTVLRLLPSHRRPEVVIASANAHKWVLIKRCLANGCS